MCLFLLLSVYDSHMLGSPESCIVYDSRMLGSPESCIVYDSRMLGSPESCIVYDSRMLGSPQSYSVVLGRHKLQSKKLPHAILSVAISFHWL